MAATTRQKVGWITANIVTILLVLIPVAVDLLAVLQEPRDHRGHGRVTFWPTSWTWENYSGIF